MDERLSKNGEAMGVLSCQWIGDKERRANIDLLFLPEVPIFFNEVIVSNLYGTICRSTNLNILGRLTLLLLFLNISKI
jgi:hypothetical protein